ncbi:hypothetical protein DL98DRAFT_429777, partial [Cadophora sp. DSE1049]
SHQLLRMPNLRDMKDVAAARRTHVSIVDLIEWGRSGCKEKVQTFRDVAELRATQDISQYVRLRRRQMLS